MKKVVPYIISSLALVLGVVACVIAVKNKPKAGSGEVGYIDEASVLSRICSANRKKSFSATLIEQQDLDKCQREIKVLEKNKEKRNLSKSEQRKMGQLEQEQERLSEALQSAIYKFYEQLTQSKIKELRDIRKKCCKEKNISFLCTGTSFMMNKEGADAAPIHPCDITEEVLKAMKLDDEEIN